MNANQKPSDGVWVDSNLFHENLNKIPPEELAPHLGRYAAVTLDGKHILLSGKYYDDLFDKADAAGLDPSEYASCYIPNPDDLA